VNTRDSDLPEHEQRAWEAIVADLSGQIDLGPQFPKERSLPPLAAAGDLPDPLEEPADLEDDEDDVGFEPPHPPPLPRPKDTAGRFAWAAVTAGPVLVLATNLLSWDSWLSGLGVALTVGGFAALIARMNDEREDDGDHGAVV
jgi:hypothetical protein